MHELQRWAHSHYKVLWRCVYSQWVAQSKEERPEHSTKTFLWSRNKYMCLLHRKSRFLFLSNAVGITSVLHCLFLCQRAAHKLSVYSLRMCFMMWYLTRWMYDIVGWSWVTLLQSAVVVIFNFVTMLCLLQRGCPDSPRIHCMVCRLPYKVD